MPNLRRNMSARSNNSFGDVSITIAFLSSLHCHNLLSSTSQLHFSVIIKVSIKRMESCFRPS